MGLKYSVLLLYAEGTDVYDQTVWIFHPSFYKFSTR
jgi:hypothetical protein